MASDQSPDRKELKAQWKTEAEVLIVTPADVAKHNSKTDNWVIIHGHAYNVTEYLRDHPGGPDVLTEVAGTDATAAYEDVGHSEDAREILNSFLVGKLQGAQEWKSQPSEPAVQVVRRGAVKEPLKKPVISRIVTVEGGALGVGAAVIVWYLKVGHRLSPAPSHTNLSSGAVLALAASAATGIAGYRILQRALNVGKDFTAYSPHISATHLVHSTSRPAGVLRKTEYVKFELKEKTELAKDIYRFVFALPGNAAVLGLPIGQHVAIRGYWEDESGHHTVTRSYTPVSNNRDLGRLELVIRCYPDGQLTGKYLVNLSLGDFVEFRGPTGAMRYRKGMSKRIGMIAGGTGLTPMYQIIRAICEDKTDTTEISLIYANRSEDDILMRSQLDRFSAQSNGQFRVYYMVDHPTPNWTGGVGFVNKQVMAERLPGPAEDTQIMLCGPPGMVNGSKKTLVGLGFKAPGAVSKAGDQIFCF